MSTTTWNWKNWQTSQSDPAWAEARKELITASVVPEFFGLSNYRPWKDLYSNAPDKGAESPYVKRGKDCEGTAVTDFGASYLNANPGGILAMVQPGLLTREVTIKGETVCLGASLDRLCLLYKGGSNGNLKLVEWVNLEIKVPVPFHGLPSEPSEIKPRYILQVVIQMWVTKINRSWLVFWREDSLVAFQINWNNACEALMDLILPLVSSMEEYYLTETGLKNRPRINPFKVYSNDVCKLIDKVDVKLASF
jgi:hypothetical protein